MTNKTEQMYNELLELLKKVKIDEKTRINIQSYNVTTKYDVNKKEDVKLARPYKMTHVSLSFKEE